MTSNGKQVVLLGHIDGGGVITVSMKVQDGANLREYPIRILEQVRFFLCNASFFLKWTASISLECYIHQGKLSRTQ